MKKILIGFLTFVVGAYAALSIVNVFAFTEPTQNPPGGNVTPNFSGISIDDGRFTVDHNNGVTTFGGNSLYIFDRQTQFNNGIGLTDGALSVNDDGITHLNRGNILLRDPLDIRGAISNTGNGNGGAVTVNDPLDIRDAISNTGNSNGGAVTVNDPLDIRDAISNTGNSNGGAVTVNDNLTMVGNTKFILGDQGISPTAPEKGIRLRGDTSVEGVASITGNVDVRGELKNNAGNLVIGDDLTITGNVGKTFLRGVAGDRINLVGGSNMNGGVLNIQDSVANRALALDSQHIQSQGSSLFLNPADNSSGVTIGGLNSDTDLTINRGDILFEPGGNAANGGIRFRDEGHFYSGSADDFVFHSSGGANLIIDGDGTIGRFYQRLSAQVNVAGNGSTTASSACDAGDIRVSCSFDTQQSVWVVPNGSFPGGADEPRTCYAKMTNRHAAEARWFRSRAYCFSPNG